MNEFNFSVDGVRLRCVFEYDGGYVNNARFPTDPHESSSMTLIEAYAGGVNIFDLLSGDTIDRVESKALWKVEQQ